MTSAHTYRMLVMDMLLWLALGLQTHLLYFSYILHDSSVICVRVGKYHTMHARPETWVYWHGSIFLLTTSK